jgi:hypothetical protein
MLVHERNCFLSCQACHVDETCLVSPWATVEHKRKVEEKDPPVTVTVTVTVTVMVPLFRRHSVCPQDYVMQYCHTFAVTRSWLIEIVSSQGTLHGHGHGSRLCASWGRQRKKLAEAGPWLMC